MRTVAYSSPFVPAEWIAAHGLPSHRAKLELSSSSFLPPVTRGMCPYAVALMDNAGKYDALVLTTVCDPMRYAASLLTLRRRTEVFLLNVPSTWQTTTARELYRNELLRLGRFLVALGGRAPTNDELVKTMLESQHPSPEPQASGDHRPGIPVAVVGGPFLSTGKHFFELVEKAGGRVALDATEGSARTSPRPFDRTRLAAEPLAELADAYFDGIVDAFQRPDDRLHRWLQRESAARGVRGIILRRYLWCDLWHAEFQRIREVTKLPVLEIDVGPEDDVSPNRMQGRLEAFFETFRITHTVSH